MSPTRRGFLAATCGLVVPVAAGVGRPAPAQAAYVSDGHGHSARQAWGSGKPGAPGVGDEVYPGLGNGGYKADSYAVDLTYAGAAKPVDGKVTMTAQATQDLSRFNLDAAGLTIRSVKVNASAATFTQSGEELVVTPAKALRKGGVFVVQVEYSADPAAIPPPAGGWVVTDDGFATAPQPAGAHTIFPCNDHPSDKAYFVFRITAPANLTSIASGTKVRERTNDDGTVTTTWVSRDPIATELVQLTVGDYKTVERGIVDGVRLRDVVPTARAAALEPALALTPGHLAWIKQHLGAFPLEAYGLLPANTDKPDAFDFTGLETQTLTIYKPNFLLQQESAIGSHMMHEIVHSWWGNSVSPASWSDLWMNEGHADFYGLIYRYERGWPDSRGFTTLEERMKYTYSQGDIWRSTSGPVAKPNADNLFDNQRYTGGVLVLYALRERIGQEAFVRLEHSMLAEYKNKSATTADYIDGAVQASGDDTVRPFLEEWLYGTTTPAMPNHPDWTVDPVPATMTQAQRNALQTDRYGT